MKKHVVKSLFFLSVCFAACDNNSNDPKTPSQSDQETTRPQKDALPDSAVIMASREVLSALKSKAFIKLSTFFHPQSGVRFSPYGYVDTATDKLLHAHEFVQAIARNQEFYWGDYDGSGDSILLSVPAYYKMFIYDADFLNAAITSINKSRSHGNSINNIDKVYPGCVYTESYFPGFDKKYGGMDWTALRLVFRREQDTFYLVAIIHDQWTT